MSDFKSCNKIPFVFKATLPCRQNLRAFIEHAKTKLDLFSGEEGYAWELMTWNVSYMIKKKGGNAVVRICFSRFGSTRWKQEPMTEPFADFVKAYIRYDYTFHPRLSFCPLLPAFRILEEALIQTSPDGIADITRTDAAVLNKAEEVLREHYSGDSLYNYATALLVIVKFLGEHDLIDAPFRWSNPFKIPARCDRPVKQTKNELKNKLPDREVLEALGTIFYTATNPRDILVASMAAILSASPARVSEVVHCRNDIEVWFSNADGSKSLGLEWYPGKGGEDGAKPIPKDFEPVVLMALKKVREITDEGRKIARWYEQHPDKLYLPPDLEYLRGKEWIDGQEARAIVVTQNYNDIYFIMKSFGIEAKKVVRDVPGNRKKDGSRLTICRKVYIFRFSDIEKYVLSWLPRDFPWIDKKNNIKYSEALFVTIKGFDTSKRATYPAMFQACSHGTLSHQISSANESNIFTRHGYSMPDGSRMGLNSHQIRHWLNTIAERGGMSDWERDFWSGRKPSSSPETTSRASAAYLHNSLEDLAEAGGVSVEVIDQSPAKENAFAKALANRAVSLEEFQLDESRPTLHITPFGYCIHAFSQSPCPINGKCLDCMEHACQKGETEKTERVHKVHNWNLKQLEAAEKLIKEEYRNMDQWFKQHKLSTMRTASLLKLLNDPELPPGTIIMLKNPFHYSALRNAVERRVEAVGDEATLAIAAKIKIPELPEISSILALPR